MISFNPGMQSEKIAVVILVAIIIGSLSIYLVGVNADYILSNLFGDEFKEKKVIESGDCADVHYIGRFASNGTIYDTSYEFIENTSGGTPLQVYINENKSSSPPSGYFSYSQKPLNMIEGFVLDLIGLKENDTKTIGPIPPDKAYGVKKLGIGDSFSTKNLALEMNQTVQVINLTKNFISLKWINIDDFSKFTMPQMILNNLSSPVQSEIIIIPPPHHIWENSSEIIDYNDEEVTILSTPTKTNNITETLKPIQYGITDVIFIFPDATTASWNETTITITSSPEIGNEYQYSQDTGFGYVMNMTFTIENIVNNTINVSVIYEEAEEKIFYEINNTLEFNRTFIMPRIYNNIPLIYQDALFGEDILREGYSTHPKTGESLIFDVEIVKIYKTSQKES